MPVLKECAVSTPLQVRKMLPLAPFASKYTVPVSLSTTTAYQLPPGAVVNFTQHITVHAVCEVFGATRPAKAPPAPVVPAPVFPDAVHGDPDDVRVYPLPEESAVVVPEPSPN